MKCERLALENTVDPQSGFTGVVSALREISPVFPRSGEPNNAVLGRAPKES